MKVVQILLIESVRSEVLPNRQDTSQDMKLGLLVRLSTIAVAATSAKPPEAQQRVDAAWDGLQQYFYNSTGFWKSCGQTGGHGGASSFGCACEPYSSFCTLCYRWWMSIGVQSLISLNKLTNGTHRSYNTTIDLIGKMYAKSPYTSRFGPSWAYIDDYMWYVLMWLDVSRWPDPGPASASAVWLSEAAATFDLMDDFGKDEPCGGLVWLYPDVDPRKNAITALEAIQAAAQLSLQLANSTRPGADVQAQRYRARALRLWSWFEGVGLLGSDSLVQDNVSVAAPPHSEHPHRPPAHLRA